MSEKIDIKDESLQIAADLMEFFEDEIIAKRGLTFDSVERVLALDHEDPDTVAVVYGECYDVLIAPVRDDLTLIESKVNDQGVRRIMDKEIEGFNDLCNNFGLEVKLDDKELKKLEEHTRGVLNSYHLIDKQQEVKKGISR